MEWRVEEDSQDHRIIVKTVYIDGDRSIEFRVLHDKISNRYVLRIVKLRGFWSAELSLIATLLPNLDLSLEYSPADKQVFLYPSPLKYVFNSPEELEQRIETIVELVRQAVAYLRDVRSSLEIVLDLTKQGWLVISEDGRPVVLRRTYSVSGKGLWIVVEITVPSMLEIGTSRLRLFLTCRDPNQYRKIRSVLTSRGMNIVFEYPELGFIEATQEVLTLGIPGPLIREVEKLIEQLTH